MTDWREEYEKQVLTKQEEEEALFEGKKKKYFKEKHRPHWEELEYGKSDNILKDVSKLSPESR